MSGRRATGWVLAGGATMVGLWWAISATQLEYVLPSPWATGRAVAELVGDPRVWGELALTLTRAGLGLALALAVGVGWGIASGKWARVNWFTLPLFQFLLSTPAVVFVILAMVWLGANGSSVVLVVCLVTLPLISAATRDAVRALDPDLVEMAHLYRFSRRTRLVHLLLPAIAPSVVTAATVALGQSVRVAVMAELLATASGMGAGLRLAQINIETPHVFAYALVLAGVTFCGELAILGPLRERCGHLGRRQAT
ncbi:ABC transporter permease [Trueperella pecoris]|uniref:ABC transporter permease subunit n=1 Tax=Trueperella pecoris TaxID=2733571 RepID=A0A7M1QXP5_9ACTO|nr:ABC transporter permease subunit [Trueperella pecoris]QOR45957.1 ABC transporter permease subunit [Trueperella pecoris]